mmetsp:Transcript_3900/g.7016  ORF Transcript_3900/g.7016 Transcript_3900/m.7016 type:complete len:82 (+) Transcript_3900:1-246(+)
MLKTIYPASTMSSKSALRQEDDADLSEASKILVSEAAGEIATMPVWTDQRMTSVSSVEGVFRQSDFKHIKTTSNIYDVALP